MIPCLHQGNICTKRKLRVWRDQKCIPLVGAKIQLTCAGRQNNPSRGRRFGPRTESCVNWDAPIAMVPCLHSGSIYTKRKLRAWRDHKCIPLVSAITPLTCAGRESTPSRGRRFRLRMESCLNWDGPITMVPCLHQGNICTKRKLRVWRDQKCIPLVGAKIQLTCAGRQNNPSRGRRFGPRTESCVNWDAPIAMVPCLHSGSIYTKRKLRAWRDHKCIPLVSAITPLTCAGRESTPSRGRRFRLRMESCLNWDGPITMVPCLHQGNICTKRKLRVWRDQKCIPLVGAKIQLTCAGGQNNPSRGRRFGPRTESCVNWDAPIAMVPCLHSGNIYTKRKLRAW